MRIDNREMSEKQNQKNKYFYSFIEQKENVRLEEKAKEVNVSIKNI